MNFESQMVSLGYSPCPNDTFIFYAMIHGKVDTQGLRFKETLLDVETLNQMARRAELDITKVSYAAFGHLRDEYVLLHSGGALGRGCGPLVVAKDDCTMADLRNKKIAVPGLMTTAFLLLQLYDPAFRVPANASHSLNSNLQTLNSKLLAQNSNIIPMPFHEIMNAVQIGEADAGLIIHESRFTYTDYGLIKILDIGEWWETETGLPIPLGAIIARRDLGRDLVRKIDSIIRNSVEYAFSNRNKPMHYIKRHSQELSDNIIRQHIDLYVNSFSLDLGQEGEEAIKEFLRRAEDSGIILHTESPLFA